MQSIWSPATVTADTDLLQQALASTDLVRIDDGALEQLAMQLRQSVVPEATPPLLQVAHASARGITRGAGVAGLGPVDDEAVLRATLLLSAVNYCFWPAADQPRWTCGGQAGFAGLLALISASTAAGLRMDLPQRVQQQFCDPALTAGLQLLPQRQAHLAEVADLLQTLTAQGDSYVLIRVKRDLGHHAAAFVAWLAQRCPGFVDVAILGSWQVPLFKRAWLATMLLDAAGRHPDLLPYSDDSGVSKQPYTFTGLDAALAIDYRLPQVLHHHGVLRYRSDLDQAVRRGAIINGDPEAALRIAAALAFRRLLGLGVASDTADLDRRLWLMARGCSTPFHRCLTTAY